MSLAVALREATSRLVCERWDFWICTARAQVTGPTGYKEGKAHRLFYIPPLEQAILAICICPASHHSVAFPHPPGRSLDRWYSKSFRIYLLLPIWCQLGQIYLFPATLWLYIIFHKSFGLFLTSITSAWNHVLCLYFLDNHLLKIKHDIASSRKAPLAHQVCVNSFQKYLQNDNEGMTPTFYTQPNYA